MKTPPSYSPEQIKILEGLQRINLAGKMVLFLVIVFTVILAALLYNAFSGKGNVLLISGLIGLNGLIGWSFQHVMKYLFPPVCKDKDGNLHSRK